MAIKKNNNSKTAKAVSEVKTEKAEVKEIKNSEEKKEENTTVQVEEKPVELEKSKDIESTDLILCQSITSGMLIINGMKSKTKYVFANIGDEEYIEYQDLLAMMLSKSANIFAPRFLIEDKKIFEDIRWKKVKEMYDTMYGQEDIEEIINLPVDDFRSTMNNIPLGLQNAVKTEVSTRVNDGIFDSLQKIKIVDEICHTEIQSLLLSQQ